MKEQEKNKKQKRTWRESNPHINVLQARGLKDNVSPIGQQNHTSHLPSSKPPAVSSSHMLSGQQRQLQQMSNEGGIFLPRFESRRKGVRQMIFLLDMATFGFRGTTQYI
jgi:hypothetical protein